MKLRSLCAVTAVALATAVTASADTVVDQVSDPANVDSADCGSTPWPLFQGFTPSRRLLASVAIRLRAQRHLPDGYSYRLKVHRDAPGAEVVGAGTATTPAPVEAGQSVLARAAFDPPLVLEPPGTYVIEGPTDRTFSVTWDVSTTDVYPGGTGYNCAAIAVPSFDFSFVTYTVPDAAAPETAIEAAPRPFTPHVDAEVAFGGTDDLSYARTLTFTCGVDGAAPAPCSTPLALRGLRDGRHTVAVAATDESGRTDPSPATAVWVVDTVPPGSPVVTGPRVTRLARPRYTFASRDSVAFLCALDEAVPKACARSLRPTLSVGPHRLRVVAVDRAGNLAATVVRLRRTAPLR